IREKIVQLGPFVMNTQAEIQQAIRDYQEGRFGSIA
ncbi:MAG: pirin-like C-terminal cupin domain-containing protein, partial [Shewanella sp.]